MQDRLVDRYRPKDEQHDVVVLLAGDAELRDQLVAELVEGTVAKRLGFCFEPGEPDVDVLSAPLDQSIGVEEQQRAVFERYRRFRGVEVRAAVKRL